MPFKSLAQAGYLHAHPEKLGKKGLAEWDAATKGKHLPEHAPKMHEGGTVPHDGLFNLKKGEKVTPMKKRPEHTHIEHHKDKSHTAKHTHHDGSTSSHAFADDKSLMEHMGGMMEGGGGGGAEPPAPPAAPGGAVPPAEPMG